MSVAKNRVAGDIAVRGAGASSPCRARSQAEIRGCAPTSRQVKRISHGTTASKTSAGSASRSTAPATAPTAQVTSTAYVVRGCSRSSRR